MNSLPSWLLLTAAALLAFLVSSCSSSSAYDDSWGSSYSGSSIGFPSGGA